MVKIAMRVKSIICFVIYIFLLGFHPIAINAESLSMATRHQKIVNATVRIEVAGIPKGTGFVAANNIIATNYHVVQAIIRNTQGGISAKVSAPITVIKSSGVILPAEPFNTSQQPQLSKYIGKDYVLLQVNGLGLKPLQLGDLGKAVPGSSIYIAGYPFGVDQPIVTKGMLSTKWKAPGNLGVGDKRNVAWLDVSMNAGNSGGPVIIFGKTPEEDKVIGIATFNLNPFAQRAGDLAEFARQTKERGSVSVMGINIGGFAELVGNALRENSLGVGGCVAIEYAKEDLKRIAQ